jgi:hypothetical protein
MAILEPADPQILSASVGPTTAAVESIAASVAAGLLLGAFAVGALGTLCRWSAADRDRAAVHASYLGGLVTLVAIARDLVIGYML